MIEVLIKLLERFVEIYAHRALTYRMEVEHRITSALTEQAPAAPPPEEPIPEPAAPVQVAPVQVAVEETPSQPVPPAEPEPIQVVEVTPSMDVVDSMSLDTVKAELDALGVVRKKGQRETTLKKMLKRELQRRANENAPPPEPAVVPSPPSPEPQPTEAVPPQGDEVCAKCDGAGHPTGVCPDCGNSGYPRPGGASVPSLEQMRSVAIAQMEKRFAAARKDADVVARLEAAGEDVDKANAIIAEVNGPIITALQDVVEELTGVRDLKHVAPEKRQAVIDALK